MHRGTSRTSAAHSTFSTPHPRVSGVDIGVISYSFSSHIRSHLIWRRMRGEMRNWPAPRNGHLLTCVIHFAQGPLLNFRLLCVILVHNQLHSTPWGEREACLLRCSRGMYITRNVHHEEFEEFRSVFPSAHRLETFSQSHALDIPSYKLEPIRSICLRVI
eukprot:COSAG02_NODE_666_length_18722_cov_237.372765_1_plen_160_part_00